MNISFDHLNATTRLIVTTNTNKTLRQIEDGEKIGQVLAVVKKYQTDWDVPTAGVPVANLRLNFYMGDKLLGNIGLGRTFLTALHQGNFVSRPFDLTTYNEVLKLLDMELKLKRP
jgi:hypothetical protein